MDENEILWHYYLHKGTASWDELAAIYNKEQGTDIRADALRKRIYKVRDDKMCDDSFRELEMKKQAFRDERNAWTKQNREQVRTEINISTLRDSLLAISSNIFPNIKPQKQNTEKKSMLILLTDWHIGADFDGLFGRYNSEIAKERATEYLKAIEDIQKIQKCEQAYVMVLGDMINGSIRRTVQLQNRENIIEQIKIASELISNFCYELCKTFKRVVYTGCAGNHTRLIENKESALKDERLDSIIDWSVSLFLKNVTNFNYIEPLDTTITQVNIYDHEIWGVHGDYDNFSKNGLQNLMTAMKRFPYMVCMGHLHSAGLTEVDGVFLVRGGSLSGAGDDYTVQKRLAGPASQTVIIFDKNGMVSVHPIVFKG